METAERVPCPYCREMILPGALKCKECGSSLDAGGRNWLLKQPRAWARNQGDRKLLGVASCLASNLRVSPTLVRLVFVLLTFVSLLGLFLYLALALVIPPVPGQRSAFEKLVDMLGAAADSLRHSGQGPEQAAAGVGMTGSVASPAPPVPAEVALPPSKVRHDEPGAGNPPEVKL